jgi:uncharacterized Zn-finger protein
MEQLTIRSSLHLIKEFRDSELFEDLELICSDGRVKACGLLIAAICPMVRECGQARSVILPDFTVAQVGPFVKALLTEDLRIEEFEVFQDLLQTLCDNKVLEIKKKNFENFVCVKCGIEKKGNRAMQQHLIWHQKHPDEDFHTAHICKECGKVCGDHSLLRAHLRLVHSPRTFECTLKGCGKSFKSKEGLKQHLSVHAGVKDFVCAECGYAVRTKHHLKLHVLKKHTEMKRSIPCEVCGKLFRHMSNLKCHFYTHKARQERQHKCIICSLTFRSLKSLESHNALHDPSRPFKCSQCPLRYKSKDALVAHENTHANLTYACQLCDVSYTRKDNLKRHFKEKHSDSI